MRGGRRFDARADGIMRLITKSGTTDMALESPLAAPAASGTALPARFYRDPDVVELEHRRIFERSWQFAAHVSRLPNPGSYLTANAGRQPVLVLRDQAATP